MEGAVPTSQQADRGLAMNTLQNAMNAAFNAARVMPESEMKGGEVFDDEQFAAIEAAEKVCGPLMTRRSHFAALAEALIKFAAPQYEMDAGNLANMVLTMPQDQWKTHLDAYGFDTNGWD